MFLPRRINQKPNRICVLVQAVAAGLLLHCASGTAASIDEAIQAYDKGDHQESYQQFYTLSRLGNPVAAKQLAYMASEGEGRDRSVVETYAFLKAAQTWGDTSVIPFIKRLEEEMSPAELVKAEEFYEQFQNNLYIKELEKVPLETAYNLHESESPRATRKVQPKYPERSARQGNNGWSRQLVFVDAAGEVITSESYGSQFGNFKRATARALGGWKFVANKPKVTSVYFYFTHKDRAETEAGFFKAIQTDLWTPALQGAPGHQRMLAEMFAQIVQLQTVRVTPVDTEVSGAPQMADFKANEIELENELPASTFTLGKNFKVSDIDIYGANLMSDDELTEAMDEIKDYNFAEVEGINNVRYRVMKDSTDRLTPFEINRPRLWTSEFWWQQAAQNGDREAQRQRALVDAQWMEYLLEENDVFAQTWLGAMLVTRGKSDTERNRGIELLRQAGNNGSDEANAILKSI